MGWPGKRSAGAGRRPGPRRRPPRARVPRTPPGAATAARAPRPAARRTARSPTAAARASSSSKNRTGDTAFFTSSIRGRNVVGGPEHPAPRQPAVERHLHERADARLELRRERVGERPVEAQDAGGRRRRRRDPRERRGHAGRRRLPDGAAEVVDAVGLLPGELLAAEVPVRGRLAVDRPARAEVADDRRRPEVERPRGRPPRSSSGSACSVPNVSTIIDTGCAVPIAYATWSWQRSASPAATTFFAT